jgi:hypothetical protein
MAAERSCARADASGRTVASLRLVGRCAVQLYQHRVVNVESERARDSLSVGAMAVCSELNP